MKNAFRQQLREPFGSAVVPVEDVGREATSSRNHPRRKSSVGRLALATAVTALTGLVGLPKASAGDITYDFTTDPSTVLTIAGNGTVDPNWQATGGNPATGGFLALTYSLNDSYSAIVFPNLDPGKIVTGFTLTADLRIGNPSGGRAADGFSISFARTGDPVLDDPTVTTGFAVSGGPENGTKTGIVVSFDTWSGNTLPDGADIEGIIVRVDNVTVNKSPLPTRNGAPDDITSMQTGTNNAAYWAGGGSPTDPAAWAELAWRPFAMNLTTDGKLTVSWKGNKVLDGFQTTYFPSGGQIVLAARTGNANEATHFDNIHLTTIAQAVTAVPGAPPNLKADAGARRVTLTWDPAVVAGDPTAKVAYEVLRDGTVISGLLTTTNFVDRAVKPGTSYSYVVHGKNIAGSAGADSTVSAKTTAETAGVAFLRADVWTGIASVNPADGWGDPHFSDPPDFSRYVNGFSFGETSNFGDTWGDNYIAVVSGVFTAPKSGNFRFFGRADDGVAAFLNLTGPAIPNVANDTPILVTDGSACCKPFQEVNTDNPPPETSAPIASVAGQQYGIALVGKEAGGGDWAQLAIREEGDPTPAGSLTPLRGSVLSGPSDPAGASVSITQQPVDTTVGANEPVTFTAAATGSSPYGADYANAVVYQWYVNGAAVLNANGATYSVAVTPKSLDKAKIKVTAAVAGASATSTEVTLTVNNDTTPPTAKHVSGSATFDSVTVTFSEPVTDPTAIDASKYTITGLTLSAGTRINDRTVKFTTTKQAENTVYPVVINGVMDNANNPSAYTGTFTSFQFKTGLVGYNTWQNQTGALADFYTDPGTGAIVDLPPTTTETRTSYVANTADTYDNYYGRIQGFFIPPTTGDYVFYFASDDNGVLYLSTDADPANKKAIAHEVSWGNRENWIGSGGTDDNSVTRGDPGSRSNISNEDPATEWASGAPAKITLTAGTRYYLEVLFKEGGGGDNGSATYKLASDPNPPVNGTSTLTGSVIGSFQDPGLLPPIITQSPVGVNFTKGDTLTFGPVVADSALPVTYQWFKTKHAIPGATGATLTIPNAGVADIGDYSVQVTNDNGSVTSVDNDARAIMKGAFDIEVEDFNYGGGQTIAAASTMPLVSDLYVGKDGLPGIDFHLENQSTADASANGNNYRQGWVNNGVTVDFPTAPEELGNSDVVQDNGGGGPGNQNRVRADFELTNNYKIGWGNAGEWYQYTRDFPAGNYNAVAAYSRDGAAVDSYGLALEIVTGDITKTNATTTVVGQLTASGSGAWSSDDLMPFSTPGGTDLATFALGAHTTVRLRLTQNDPDIDYLLFYPAGAVVTPPTVTVKQNADGSITVTWSAGKLQSAPTLNGTFADVPGATSPYTFTPPGAELFGRVVQ